jgi:streptomycin 6-kinase
VLKVPTVVRNTAGALGVPEWLDELPSLVAGLEREWGITVGRAYGDATEAFVAEATLPDGAPAVLKVLVPHRNAARDEVTVLRLAGGDGCVRLLRHDVERGALLLERLGRSLFQLRLPVSRRHEILCGLAARVWRPAPGCGLPTGSDKGRRLVEVVEKLWEALDHPCSARAVDDALACAARRIAAHDDARAVLLHGDVHEWNALEAPGGGFRLVDPDGLLAEPEYDMGILMREDPVELFDAPSERDPRARARWLADRTGLDAEAIWEWGVIERVANGLLLTEIDLQPVGRQMLAAADRVAGR